MGSQIEDDVKLGTCRHTYQIQEMWRVPVHRQPHEPAEQHIRLPEVYTCQWLDHLGELPPSIKRRNGSFELRPGDCESCPHYQPAGQWPTCRQDAEGA